MGCVSATDNNTAVIYNLKEENGVTAEMQTVFSDVSVSGGFWVF